MGRVFDECSLCGGPISLDQEWACMERWLVHELCRSIVDPELPARNLLDVLWRARYLALALGFVEGAMSKRAARAVVRRYNEGLASRVARWQAEIGL